MIIKKILFQIGIASTIGLGTLLSISPIRIFTSQYLTNPILQIVVGGLLIGGGLWLVSRFGKEFDMCN